MNTSDKSHLSKLVLKTYLILSIVVALFSSAPAYSQNGPQFLWEVRTYSGGLSPVPPFLNWTLSPASWNEVATNSNSTLTEISTFSGNSSPTAMLLAARAESFGSIPLDSASNVYVIYHYRAYVKGPASVSLQAISSATVSNTNSGPLASYVGFGPIPFGNNTVNADLPAAGTNSNSGGNSEVLPPGLTCGAGNSVVFPQYPNDTYYLYHSGSVSSALLYNSSPFLQLTLNGLADGSVLFVPTIGDDDPTVILQGPIVNGLPTPDPPIGSNVSFHNLSFDSDNQQGTTALTGICSAKWTVTNADGTTSIYNSLASINFSVLPGEYTVKLEVTDNEGVTSEQVKSFHVGPVRYGRPGDNSTLCDGDQDFAAASVSPSSGNIEIMFSDSVRTRSFPLKNTIHLNTQSALGSAPSTPMGNAFFSYGIRVTQANFSYNSQSTNWTVLDGDGKELDFGPTTSAPNASDGIFSKLTFNPSSGFELENAAEPTRIEESGNFRYSFNLDGRLTSLTDPHGNVQSISYNSSGNPLQVTDHASNKTLTFAYNTAGLIDTITANAAGSITELTYQGSLLSGITIKDNFGTIIRSAVITYNSEGLPETLTKDNDPATTLTFSHIKAGNNVYLGNISDLQGGDTNFYYSEIPTTGSFRISQTNVRSGVTYYEYDQKGDLIAITLPPVTGATQSVKYLYAFNQDHKLTSISDGATSYSLAYTDLGLLSSITNNLGEFKNYTYNFTDLIAVADNIGKLINLKYEDPSHQHLVTSITDGSGNIWRRTYNQFGQELSIIPPRGSPQRALKFEYFENPASSKYGYLKTITNGAGDTLSIDNYSSLGDIQSVSSFPSTTVTNLHSFLYDASHRMTSYIAPNGSTIDHTYNGKNLSAVKDEANQTTTYEYCPSCSKYTAVHAALGKNLSWNLDADKLITKFVDPRLKETQFMYGVANELKQVIFPADPPAGNFIYNLSYDNSARLKTLSKTGINSATFLYDGVGRLGNIDYPGSNNASDSSYEYYTDGRLKRVVDDIGTTSYLYNASRMKASVKYNYTPHLLMQEQELLYTYYPDNSIKTMTWRNGGVTVATWNYSYDRAGRLKSVNNSYNESVTYDYDKESKLIKETRGNASSTDYQYFEPRGWPSKITDSINTTPFADYTLEYDLGQNSVGNITKVTELDGSVVDYSYDALYRLISEVRTGSNSYPIRNYTYDLSGNITEINGASFASYSAANDVKSISGGIINNFNGRVFDYSGPAVFGSSFFYDDDLNLAAQNIGGSFNTNYRTDGQGRRVLQWLSPNTQHVFYIYDGARLIGEIDRNGVPQVAYTWGHSGLVSQRQIPLSQSRYYHFGPQGETRYLTNSAGAVTDSYVYLAYGKELVSSGNSYNRHRYGGRFGYYNDGLNGHLLVGRRWYSTYLMRWLTYDPIGYQGGTNLYQYVSGNPVNRVDPSGMFDLDFSAGFHVPVSPGVAVGPSVSSSVKGFSNDPFGAPLQPNPATLDVGVGLIADIGVAVGISDLSGTGGLCASSKSYSLGFGKYSGITVTPRIKQDSTKSFINPLRYIDGVQLGLGGGVALPFGMNIDLGELQKR